MLRVLLPVLGMLMACLHGLALVVPEALAEHFEAPDLLRGRDNQFAGYLQANMAMAKVSLGGICLAVPWLGNKTCIWVGLMMALQAGYALYSEFKFDFKSTPSRLDMSDPVIGYHVLCFGGLVLGVLLQLLEPGVIFEGDDRQKFE